MSTCPCCGQETDRPTLESLQWVALPRSERIILDKLVETYPRKLSGDQLADWLYQGRTDGGPLSGRRNIDVYLCRMRPKIASTGWWVGRTGYGEAIGLHFVGNKKQAAA